MLKLSDIMTRDVVTVTPQTTLRDAVELFTSKHISGAPVVDGKEVVGVVSATDVLGFAAATPDAPTDESPQWSDITEAGDEQPDQENVAPGSYFNDYWSGELDDVTERITSDPRSERNLLDAHLVDEVMTRNAVTLSPNDLVTTAASLMQRKAIHRIVVVEEGVLVGIVSALDVARAVAEHKLTSRTYVFDRPRHLGEPPFPL